MTFASPEFVAFLLLVLLGTSRLPNENARRHLLLVASYVFYGWWDWRFTFLMLATASLDWFVGLRLERMPNGPRRRALLIASLCANLGVLAYFKYTNLLLETLAPWAGTMGWTFERLDIVLPVGISFFTFQSMSYTVDVYRRHLPATRSYRDFLLFVAFFPQLVAGPIVRGSEFLPQLALHDHRPTLERFRHGLAPFLRGLIKKVLLADSLALMVDPVYANPTAFTSASVWWATLAYTWQIYFDFSGYTDMAIGCGRMFGFEFPVNFRHPYLATSLTDFWRRWHITLSTWLRDYLYIPLGGNRKGEARTMANLLLTMLLGGLWHGASWTFLAWGAWHGLGLAASRIFPFDPIPGRFGRFAGWAMTFGFVMLGWVVFRAGDFASAAVILGKLFGLAPQGADWWNAPALVALLVGASSHLLVALRGGRDWTLDLRDPIAWACVVVGLLLMVLFAPLESSPFIYFRF
jgi:alginate O-acetyltransferase complex protein AlgI